MDNQRKLIVGYDLCDDFSQISCYSYKTFEPVTICPNDEEENSLIPTALCIRSDTKLWIFGNEAVNCAGLGNGVLVDHLLTKIRTGEETEIYGQKYNGVSLLEKYFRKTLTLLKNHFPTETITKLVITIHDMEPAVVDGIYEALGMLGIEKDRAAVMSHASSYMYFALSQERSLWINDVGLFDFHEDGLCFCQISVNRRLNPMVAGLEKKDFTKTLNLPMLKQKNLDASYIFQNVANTVLYKQIISTLYFTGRGFTGGWADEAIKGLCTGRRIFIGQNLYTKGACYAAKELSCDRRLGDIILLNNEMLVSSVWIRVYTDAAVKEVLLADAAIPWYEVNKSIEVIPDEMTELEMVFRNIMTREIIRQRIPLGSFFGRPERMTRLEINLTCINRSRLKIRLKDMGFGEFYQESGRVWEHVIDI